MTKIRMLPDYIKVPIDRCSIMQIVGLLDWSGFTIPEIADSIGCEDNSIRYAISTLQKRGIYVNYADTNRKKVQYCMDCERYAVEKHRAMCSAVCPKRQLDRGEREKPNTCKLYRRR